MGVTPISVVELTAAVPIIPARDVQLAVAWYCEKLGFNAVHVERDYGIARRGPLELHFWGPSGIAPEDSMYMYRVHVEGIDELYGECHEAGIVHPSSTLEEKSWGTREFAVVDRDGNLLTFFTASPSSNALEREFPHLFQLLGGYLHQDFDADHESADAALAAAAHEAPERVAGAVREIEALLASPRDERALGELVDRLTSGYSPELDGWEVRPWLAHAARILRGDA